MRPEAKVVLFGPAHSGKSTLAGYLWYQSAREAAEAEIAAARSDLGVDFDESQALAYLVDISGDERRRTFLPKAGQSKRLHVSPFIIRGQTPMHFYTLDTPGAQHNLQQRHRGIVFSDAGLYCVEARALLDNIDLHGYDKIDENLAFVLSWSIMRPQSPLVIVLTKMDMYEWKAANIDKIRKFRDVVTRRFKIEDVIPISIDVPERTSINIQDGERTENYETCLFMAMKHISQKIPKEFLSAKASSALLFVVSKLQYEKGIGIRMLGKVMKGTVRSKLAILIYQKNSEMPIPANVKRIAESSTKESPTSLMHEVAELYEGDLGAISISSTIDLDQPTLVCDVKTPMRCGKVVRIRVTKFGIGEIGIYIGREITILYLGTKFSARVADLEGLHGSTNEFFILALILSGVIWIPFEDTNMQSNRNFKTVFILPNKNDERLISGFIEECGLRVHIDIRDEKLEMSAVARGMNIRSAHGRVANEDRDEDNIANIEFLLGIWRNQRESREGRAEEGPIKVSILPYL